MTLAAIEEDFLKTFFSGEIDPNPIIDWNEEKVPHLSGGVVAELLRRTAVEARVAKISLTIKNGRFDKELNLCGLGRQSNALIELLFENCEFADGLNLDHVEFSSLAVIDCKSPLVRARHCNVMASARIKGLAPLPSRRECEVDLSYADIGGKLIFENCHLTLSDRTEFHAQMRPDYALEMSSAHIGSDISIIDGTFIEDGIHMTNVECGGNIWLLEATITGNKGDAIFGQSCRLHGSIVALLNDDLIGTRIFGTFDLLDANVGGIYLPGVVIDNSVDSTALNWTRLTVERDIHLGQPDIDSRDAEGLATSIKGAVALNSARIAGDVFLGEMELRSSRPADLTNMDIGGSLSIYGDYSQRADSTASPRISCAIHLDNTSVGKDFYLLDIGLIGDMTAMNMRIAGSTQIQRIVSASGEKSCVDLRNFTTDVLDDGHGTEWGDVALRLGGFRYEFARDPSLTLVDRWKSRRSFLEKQLTTSAADGSFNPDGFNHAARVFKSNGQFADADGIVEAKVRQEFRETARRNRVLSPLILACDSIYRKLFRYGLSTSRALATVLGFIILGTVATYIFNANDWMTLTATPTTSLVTQAEPRNVVFATVQVDDAVTRIACANAIVEPLYAVDTFIPLIDLGQETKCDVDDNRQFLVFLKALFKLMGWLTISLAILTVSGVLRRQIDG